MLRGFFRLESRERMSDISVSVLSRATTDDVRSLTAAKSLNLLGEERPAGPDEEDLADHVECFYDLFGQRKEMGRASERPDRPHFFLLRTFAGENDLLVILNSKRCRYKCAFCTLPFESSRDWVADRDILQQFRYIVDELKHALSVIERVTLSNEGSVLDAETLGPVALEEIVKAVGRMRRVRRIELETRLEFVQPDRLRRLGALAPRARLGILTGFETRDERIRDRVLKKGEPLKVFCSGLDQVAEAGASLTAYVLFKPDSRMTDEQACEEAAASIRYLDEQCRARGLPLSLRLNPMYSAEGSRWAREAAALPGRGHLPPRLTDVMRVAEKESKPDLPIYIGLSTEGLAGNSGSYTARDDYGPHLIRYVKLFNDGRIDRFPWQEIERAAAGGGGSGR
jgi:hypothetical protein